MILHHSWDWPIYIVTFSSNLMVMVKGCFRASFMTLYCGVGLSKTLKICTDLLWRIITYTTLHNVYIVQYVFLPAEQSETYFKNFILTYDLTYICPGLFDWKENTFFFIFVKSNSKSGRFSSFLMPNNFGTGQKKAYFLGALEN